MQLNSNTPTSNSNTQAPEKILQFGTGVLLRGLCDFLVDKGNKAGVFNGRIVVVKSTASGGVDAFDEQDGRYTVAVRGIEAGETIKQNIIVDAISRVIAASTDWQAILDVAANPTVEVIISNTTEVGIQYVDESIFQSPPSSFPAKLLAVLHRRFEHHPSHGFVIIPTELIVNNGTVLREIVLKLAASQRLNPAFLSWIRTKNQFCNSLVDRIVPGKPNDQKLKSTFKELGYTDDLLIETEAYKLWAIEGDESVAAKLSFAQADEGVVITPDIEIYRELKLRLLNGTHSFLCGLGYLYGHRLVREVMDDSLFYQFVKDLMLSELAPSIPYDVEEEIAQNFGLQVLDRFKNPFVDHQLLAITVQYSTKMKARNLPLLNEFVKRFGQIPSLLCCGFAGYILFMKAVKIEGGKYFGELNGEFYEIKCDKAGLLFSAWQSGNINDVVNNILSNMELWNQDLTQIEGFADAVKHQLSTMMHGSVREALQKVVGVDSLI